MILNYCTSRKNSLELIELSSFNKISNTGSIRDDPYWTPRKNSLELIELSSFTKISNTGWIRDDPYSRKKTI
jgi:hypothetical protein